MNNEFVAFLHIFKTRAKRVLTSHFDYWYIHCEIFIQDRGMMKKNNFLLLNVFMQ